jgi:hypothetical protein
VKFGGMLRAALDVFPGSSVDDDDHAARVEIEL